jgi:hypothetical protein
VDNTNSLALLLLVHLEARELTLTVSIAKFCDNRRKAPANKPSPIECRRFIMVRLRSQFLARLAASVKESRAGSIPANGYCQPVGAAVHDEYGAARGEDDR